jgi:hypothetical protein
MSEAVDVGIDVAKASILAVMETIAARPQDADGPLREHAQAHHADLARAAPHLLPSYAVKQHWHARFHAETGNAWLRRTVAQLFGGG